MKIIDTIKGKYFPHKVKLIAGEKREYLTDLDKAFIYACVKLGIRNNRKGWFNKDKAYFNSQEYVTNKYDFFKFNFKVQRKCCNTGHLLELIYGMTLKLSYDCDFWMTYFKFMRLFNDKKILYLMMFMKQLMLQQLKFLLTQDFILDTFFEMMNYILI